MALSVSDRYVDEAAEIERMGYSAVWLPGGQIGPGGTDEFATLPGSVSAGRERQE